VDNGVPLQRTLDHFQKKRSCLGSSAPPVLPDVNFQGELRFFFFFFFFFFCFFFISSRGVCGSKAPEGVRLGIYRLKGCENENDQSIGGQCS